MIENTSRGGIMKSEDAAAYLGVGKRAIKVYVQKYALPYHKVPGMKRVYFFKDELDDYVRRCPFNAITDADIKSMASMKVIEDEEEEA